MAKAANIESLQKLTSELINDALKEIRSKWQNSPGDEPRLVTAIYFLEESRAYVDAAWNVLTGDNALAALTLSRWVLEAAMNLWWAVADQRETEQRLTDLVGEALRNDAILSEDLTKIWPDLDGVLRDKAKAARSMRSNIGARNMPSLAARMEATKPPDKPDWPDLYVLFRMCSAAAHPGLTIWERFENTESVALQAKPAENTLLTADRASWMTAASALYLVSHCFCLSGTGDAQALKDWWSNGVRPLLS